MYGSYPSNLQQSGSDRARPTNNNTNRQFQEAATLRKASNDTQYFWDLVNRQRSGNFHSKRVNKAHEEHQLFAKKIEQINAAPGGIIDDNIPVQRSGPRSDEFKSLETFEELRGSVPDTILHCIEMLKYEKPTPIQKHAIPLGLGGLDLMCCAQTVSLTILFLKNKYVPELGNLTTIFRALVKRWLS